MNMSIETPLFWSLQPEVLCVVVMLTATVQTAEGGRRERKRRGGGRQLGHGNLREDSRGPGAAELKSPGFSDPPYCFSPAILFKQKLNIQFRFIFFSVPASFLLPLPIVARTWAGKTAPWLGRTETWAGERRGKNKWTTLRKSLFLKKSSEREYL